MKPLIGITTEALANIREWGPEMYGQNYQYSDAIVQAGGLPVLIPFTEDYKTLRGLYERLDGVLFAGGGDIDPEEYGEEPSLLLENLSPARDHVELQLMKWAIADDKPILSICRGYQLLNVALGGTLFQDIPSMVEGAENHDISSEKHDRSYVAHHLRIDKDSRLAGIIGSDPIDANSHHHQAIKKVAPGLEATAWANDQIIEAVELSRSRFVIGVQCHPESLTGNEPRWGKLFRQFAISATPYSIPASERKSASTDVALEAL